MNPNKWYDIDIGGIVKAFLDGEYRMGKLEKYRVYLRLQKGKSENKTGNVFGKDLACIRETMA